MAKNLNVLSIAILGVLGTGCGDSLDLKAVANPSARLEGAGYSVLPPPGSDWYLAEAVKNGIQFVKLEPGEDVEEAPRRFFVGAFPFPANGTAGVSDKDFPRAVESLLVEHFTQARRRLKSLSLSPYASRQGLCVQYDSVQLQERSGPNPTRQPLEFSGHGFVCRHSTDAKTLVHGFYTHRYFANLPVEIKKSTLQEAQTFLKNVELTQP